MRNLASRSRCAALPSAFDAGGGQFSLDLGPLATEGFHQDRLHQRLDVGFAGVVRAQLRALAFIQRALKKRAHDARLDELPVGLGGFAQNAKLRFGEFKDG